MPGKKTALASGSKTATLKKKKVAKKPGLEFIQDQAEETLDCMIVVKRPAQVKKNSEKLPASNEVIPVEDDEDENENEMERDNDEDRDYSPEQGEDDDDDDEDEYEDEEEEEEDDDDDDEEYDSQDQQESQQQQTVIQAITPLRRQTKRHKEREEQLQDYKQQRVKKQKTNASKPAPPPPAVHALNKSPTPIHPPAQNATPTFPIFATSRLQGKQLPLNPQQSAHQVAAANQASVQKKSAVPPAPKTPEEIRSEAMHLMRQLSTSSTSSTPSTGENGRRQYCRQQSEELSRGKS